MKFIHYLENISGVSIYPMISLLLFTTVFTYVLYSTFSMRKKDVEEKSQIPLD
jgi:hypothetical protein